MMKDTATKGTLALGFILLIFTLIIIGPILLIWSLNTLFGLSIPFTLKTWCASLILGGAVSKKGGNKS